MELLATITSSTVVLVTLMLCAALILRPRFLRKALHVSRSLGRDLFSSLTLWCGLFPALLSAASGRLALSALFVSLACIPPVLVPSAVKAKERMKVCVAALSFEAFGLLVFILDLCWGASGSVVAFLSLSVGVLYLAVFFSLFGFRLSLISRPSGRTSLSSAAALLSDAVYLLFSLLLVSLTAMFPFLETVASGGYTSASVLLEAVALAGNCVLLVMSLLRRSIGRNFLILGNVERMVGCAFEECLGNRGVRTDNKNGLYRNIFERVEEYFRSDSPYLEANLSINDVSDHIYTNKVYISRAISECSGSNFCQYVNGYRIRYAMDCFCQDPTLKVTELAYMSGFRTVASYNMAFRRIMGEIPSEWMRRTTDEIRCSRAVSAA